MELFSQKKSKENHHTKNKTLKFELTNLPGRENTPEGSENEILKDFVRF